MFRNRESKERKIIQAIHDEFDSAQDRLLIQAREIIEKSKVSIVKATDTENLASRLTAVGFKSTPIVKKAEKTITKNKELTRIMVRSSEQAELIERYKMSYPFQKFLTEEELDRICTKYGLIHAPVENYIKDIPIKNLMEIEAAKPLSHEDKLYDYTVVNITKFWRGTPDSVKEMFKGDVRYEGSETSGKPAEHVLQAMVQERGINYTGYVFHTATVKVVNVQGLFICAPPSHFDLKNLSKETKLGFHKVTITKVNDPIVYRYCKGGIQVVSKWGLEASDPGLLNEIEN